MSDTEELDRARDTAAALEAENARLTAKVERVDAVARERDVPWPSKFKFGASDNYLAGFRAANARFRAALSDTTGEATSETRAGAGVYGRLPGRLCDPDGWVRSGFWHHGTDYQCTGSAHLGSTEIVCTNPVHDQPDTTGEATR